MNGNKTLMDLKEDACAFGIASRAVQDERDKHTDKRIEEIRDWISSETLELKTLINEQTKRINRLYIAQLPSALSLIGIVVTIIMLLRK